MRRAAIAIIGLLSLAGCAQPGFQALSHKRAAPDQLGSPSAVAPAPSFSDRRYVGVSVLGAPPSYEPITVFQRAIRVAPEIILYYSGWNEPFQAKFAQTAWKHHATVLVQITPALVSLQAVAAGRDDPYLRQFARQVGAFGHPVIIGFAHEMNGNWYRWGYGRTPVRTWIAAWRHVVTLFRNAGARNAVWLWNVSHNSPQRIRRYWPGSKYVTWVGIDGYFAWPADTFTSVFGPAMKVVRHLTRKPILIGETAAGQLTHHQAADIASMFAGARRYHLLGLVYFDVAQHQPPVHQDWRLEGHHALVAAFRLAARRFLAGR